MPPRDAQGAQAPPRRPRRRGNSISAITQAVAHTVPAPAPRRVVTPPQQSSVFGGLHSADAPIRQALHQATRNVQRAQQREPNPAPPQTPVQRRALQNIAQGGIEFSHQHHLVPDYADPIIRHELGVQATNVHENRPFDVAKVSRAIQMGLPEAKNLANIGGTIFRRDNQDRSVLQGLLNHDSTPVPLDPRRGGISMDSSRQVREAQASMASASDPVKSSALFALNQVTRPVHGVETGLDAALTGGNPLAGAAKGFLHTNQAVIGSQLLGHLGVHNKALAAAGGFGLDVGLDPTTYLSGGASIPAKEAAREAAEIAARDAAHAAASEGPRAAAQAESAAYQRAYEETFAAHPGKARGVHVGGRVHVPLTNVTLQGRTGALGSTLFADARHRFGEAARQGGTKRTAVPSAVTRAASHVTPQMRPPGFTDAQWETLRQNARVYRGNVNARERQAMETAQGLHRSLGPGENPNFVAGLETIGPLTREQQALHGLLNETAGELQARDAIRGRIGGHAPPEVPVASSLEDARKAVGQARRERLTAEREHRALMQQVGVARGRSEVLSRNVGGRSAEVGAQRAGRRLERQALKRSLEADPELQRIEAQMVRLPPNDPRRLELAGELASSKVELADIRQASGKVGPRPTEDEISLADAHLAYQGTLRSIQDLRQREASPEGAALQGGMLRSRLADLEQQATRQRAHRDQLAQFIDHFGGVRMAGGGMGVAEAHNALRASEQRVRGAREGVAQAQAGLEGVHAERATQRAAQRQLDIHNVSAQRFFPHTAEAELQPKGAKLPGRPGGASASSFTSGKHRRYVEPIHLQTNNAVEHFSTNVPAVVGHYLTKAGRRIEGSDYWNRVAGLGKVLTHGSNISLEPGEMVYKVDAEGLHPIESKLEPGTVNEAKVRRALASAGQHSDPADKFVVMPSHVVEQAKTMVQRGSGSEHAFVKAYDTVLGQTKAFQTIRNPAYQLTNLSGDAFMARQAGATTRDFTDAWTVSQEAHRESAHRTSAAAAQGEQRAASDATVTIRGKKVPAAEIADRFRKQGLQEGHVVDIQDVLGHQLKSTRLRRFNTARELYPRYATFISGLKRGLSDQAAARLVVEHHFDYSDLTPAERGLRRVIPFYTFARRNAGLQARKLVTNPRVQAHFQEAREEAASASGQPKDWEDTLRGYERQGLPFPLPGGLKLFSRMPVTDLNQLTLDPKTALRNITTRTAAPLTMPFELATNRDFFFNAPINPNDPATNRVQSGAKGLVPAPNIPGLTPALERLGIVKPIQNTHGKGMVPGWSPYMPFLLRSLPQTNYAQQIATNSPGTNHGVSAGLSVLNLLSGIKLSQGDSAKDAYTQALTYSNDLQSKINTAQQRGRTGKVAALKDEMKALQKALPVLRKAAGYTVKPRARRRSRSGTNVVLGGGSGGSSSRVILGGGGSSTGSKVILGGG